LTSCKFLCPHSLSNAFGANFSPSGIEVSGGVHFTQDVNHPTVIYPVGRHIGVRDAVTNDMRFIKQPDNLKEVTAMSLSPNRRFLAVCERQYNHLSAFISIYDMKTPDFKIEKNRLSVCDTVPNTQKTIKSIGFSYDSKHIAAIIEGPDSKAIAWEWFSKTKSRIIGQYEFGKQVVSKITFKPNDAHVVCTSGHGHWKLWKP
jgi:hypothetical protein